MKIAFDELIKRFDAPGVRALVLVGSHARGEAGPYSDIDLVRFTDGTKVPGDESYLYQGYLLVVSNALPDQVERCFREPLAATDMIGGLRRARVLLDREGYFALLQARAYAFVWDEAMQQRANLLASEMLAGYAEEARKGLEGLCRNDIGRLLSARYGFSWGMSRVVKVQRGVLISSHNSTYDEVARGMSDQPEWVSLRRAAFGIEDEHGRTLTLREQVQAGLRLYVLTAELLSPVLLPEHRPIIEQAVSFIRAALPVLPDTLTKGNSQG